LGNPGWQCCSIKLAIGIASNGSGTLGRSLCHEFGLSRGNCVPSVVLGANMVLSSKLGDIAYDLFDWESPCECSFGVSRIALRLALIAGMPKGGTPSQKTRFRWLGAQSEIACVIDAIGVTVHGDLKIPIGFLIRKAREAEGACKVSHIRITVEMLCQSMKERLA
jgi:hypothetical protein